MSIFHLTWSYNPILTCPLYKCWHYGRYQPNLYINVGIMADINLAYIDLDSVTGEKSYIHMSCIYFKHLR